MFRLFKNVNGDLRTVGKFATLQQALTHCRFLSNQGLHGTYVIKNVVTNEIIKKGF